MIIHLRTGGMYGRVEKEVRERETLVKCCPLGLVEFEELCRRLHSSQSDGSGLLERERG